MDRGPKRMRSDNGYGGRRDGGHDDISPSPVVFLNALPEMITNEDVIADLTSFGPISYVLILTKRRQALVEFEDITSAVTLVDFAKKNPVYVGGRPVQATFSTSQKLERQYGDGARPEERPNNVLLYTILNPMYPITVDVLNTISTSHGKVNRIVIFRKQGVQAMVEFDTVEMAQRAKQSLNGADIYSGCCTLKIEYARPTRLNVIRNDNDSWDYTNPTLGVVETPTRSQPLLADPPYPAKPYGGGGHGAQNSYDPYQGEQQQQFTEQGFPPEGRGPRNLMAPQRDPFGHEGYASQDPYSRGGLPGHRGPPGHDRGFHPHMGGDSYGGGPDYQRMDGPPSAGMLQQNSVVMMYGLNPEKMNCQRVFNLFCIYGNVVRIKFLRSKEGSGMVQMGAPDAMDRVCKFLNGTYFYGKRMNLAPSKQAFLQDVPNPYDLPDGSKSFEDFMGNRNNRYTSPDAAMKNRIHPPSKTLYFWNAPPGITEDQVVEVFDGLDCKLPVKVKIFPSKTEKSSTGLVEFDNKLEAVEAVCVANHKEIPNSKSKYPFIMKLCFSENPIITKRPHQD